MGNVENGYCTLQSVATGFYLTAGENAGNMVTAFQLLTILIINSLPGSS